MAMELSWGGEAVASPPKTLGDTTPAPQSQAEAAKRQQLPVRTLADLHGCIVVLLSLAPNNFTDAVTKIPFADQEEELRARFDNLRSGFRFAERRLRDNHMSAIARELIEMSLAAYLAGDRKTGNHILQECEGLIWPSRALRPKYAIEAERRVFDENTVYKGMVMSPYPYEGSAADLGPDQAVLLKLAENWCHSYHSEGKDFYAFSWVMTNDGIISRISQHPVADNHPVLKPLQRRFGFKRLKQLAESGTIRACILVQRSGSGIGGSLIYEIDQSGIARVTAIEQYSSKAGGMRYEKMRYHLMDPGFITSKPVHA